MTTKIFRSIIIFNLVGLILGSALAWSRFATLPPELAEFARRDNATHIWLNFGLWLIGTCLVAVQFVSLIGLLMLRNWARYTYLTFLMIWIILCVRPGLSFDYTWMGALEALTLISSGAIVSTVIWPPSSGFFSTWNKNR